MRLRAGTPHLGTDVCPAYAQLQYTHTCYYLLIMRLRASLCAARTYVFYPPMIRMDKSLCAGRASHIRCWNSHVISTRYQVLSNNSCLFLERPSKHRDRAIVRGISPPPSRLPRSCSVHSLHQLHCQEATTTDACCGRGETFLRVPPPNLAF